MYLGLDLTPRSQRLLTRAQAKVTKLTPIVAAARPGKKPQARKQLAKAQAIVSRYTQSHTETPYPTPVAIPTPTAVWLDPVSGTTIPVTTTVNGSTPTAYIDPTTGAITEAPVETSLVSGVPNTYLMLGVIALFMLFKKKGTS